MDHLTTDLLVPLLDGELPADEARRCREHLTACEACRLEADQLGGVCQPGGVWDLMDAVPSPVVPQGLADAILARAATEKRSGAVAGSRLTLDLRSILGRRWIRFGVPVAAAAAIILAVLLSPAFLSPALLSPGMQTEPNPMVDQPIVNAEISASDVERILELQESLDVMNEYGDLIEYYDVLKNLDRILQDENVTL